MTKGIRKILISGLFFVLAGCLSVGFNQSKSSVMASANELKAEEGAQTRLVEPYGLRFSAYLDEEKYQEITDENGIEEGKTIGLIVAPTKYFEDYAAYKTENPEYAGEYFEYFRDVKGKMIHQTYSKEQIVQNTGNNATQYPWVIRLAVVDILFDNVDLKMSSVAYIKTEGVGYDYADVSNGRSVSYVSSAYLNEGNSSSVLEETLTKFAYKQLGVTYDYEATTDSVYVYDSQSYTWDELLAVSELNPASVYALSQEEVTLDLNSMQEVSFTNQKVAGLNVKWTTENDGIVTVENGVLKAVGCGETVVTAQVGQYSDSVTVTVPYVYQPLEPVSAEFANNTIWEGGGPLIQGIDGAANIVASTCTSAHHINFAYTTEKMDTLTIHLMSGSWVGGTAYNSLLRIKLAFNGEVYSYNANNNTWVDSFGVANPCIAMTYEDGTVANLAAMTADEWTTKFVTFTVSRIYTDLQVVMAPPAMGVTNAEGGSVDLCIAYSSLWEDKLENDDVYSVGAWLSYDAHWSTMDIPYTGAGGYLVSQADGNKGFFINGYVEGMNTVAVKMSALNGWADGNSLLRLQLRYNGTTYTYDATSNTWKDGAGNVGKVTMKYEDGTDVNLGAMTDYVNVPVTFIISDITTDLKLVLNPPAYGTDNANGIVHINFHGHSWYSFVSVDISTDVQNINLKIGEMETATVNVSHDGVAVVNPVFAWSSNDEKVAIVNNGVITAIGEGETIVTATYTYNGLKYKVVILVTVIDPYVPLEPVYSSININTSWAGGGSLMQGIEGGWNTVASVCSSAHHIAVPYAGEMMDTLTLRIASGNWVGGAGYNSLLRIKLAFNGSTYTYNVNNNSWVDALGTANPCIAMTYADGTEANLAAMTSDTWVLNYVTFTISQIYTDLQIVMAPPVMGSAESDGCVDLAIAYSPLWEDKLKNDDVYSVGAWLSYDAHWSTMDIPYTGAGGYLVSQADGNKGFFINGYVEGMNTVAVKMSALNGWADGNSLLRLQLRYNGTTYTYDATSNTWKDGAGNVGKVTMKYEDGTDVNLGAMTDYVNVPVTFIISDITTDLKLVLNPPAYGTDNANGIVHINFHGYSWYSK